MALIVAGDGRARLRLVAAVPRLLRGDRLRRHDRSAPNARRARSRARSECASTPISIPACRGASSPSRTTVSVEPGAQTKIFYRAQNLSARTMDRPGGVQRLPRPGRQIFQEDPMLLLHRADAESRARTSTCRWCFSSIPQIKQGPRHQGHPRDYLELHILPGGNRRPRPARAPTKPTREAARHGRDEEPRLPSGRSRSVADHRRGLRRHAVQRRGDVVPRQSLRQVRHVARPRRRAGHDVQLVVEHHPRGAHRLSHAGRPASPALRHDPVHRLGSDVLPRLVLGLLRQLALPVGGRAVGGIGRPRASKCSTRGASRCSTR